MGQVQQQRPVQHLPSSVGQWVLANEQVHGQDFL